MGRIVVSLGIVLGAFAAIFAANYLNTSFLITLAIYSIVGSSFVIGWVLTMLSYEDDLAEDRTF